MPCGSRGGGPESQDWPHGRKPRGTVETCREPIYTETWNDESFECRRAVSGNGFGTGGGIWACWEWCDCMATVSAEHAPHDVRAIRIAIVGNSNSVMQDAYVRVLENTPGWKVTNRSIGSSPNIVLLAFLGREPELDYDFIIIETAVVDSIQAGPLYPRERSLETLELFISHVRRVSRAQIIILTIPTRYALLAPDAYWQEQLYRETAARLGVPILDGFRVVRQLIGQTKMSTVGECLSRTEHLVAAFDLPRNVVPSLAWRGLRERHVRSNALGVSAFVDHAHFSAAMHALVGSILADFIASADSNQGAISDRDRGVPPIPPPVIALDPSTASRVVRTSSLMSRDLIALRIGETARYECPPGYRAYGLLLNQSKTTCFLQLSSPAGSVAFDMRYGPMPFDWIAVVVPIIDRIGDGPVEIMVLDAPPDATACHQLHNTDSRFAPRGAELGELILVREDWRDRAGLPAVGNSTALHLEESTWAKWAIEEASRRAAPVVKSLETDGRFVPAECGTVVANLLAKGTTPLSLADQARLLYLLGMADQLPGFFEASLQNGDQELQRMLEALRTSRLGEVASDADLSGRRDPVDTPASSPNPHRVDFTNNEAPLTIQAITQDKQIVSALSGEKQAVDADDPIVLLERALERSPEQIGLLRDLARAHESRKNWPEAESYWRRYIARDNRHWWTYAALAAALRAQQRDAESDVVLYEGIQQLPAEPQILAETARAAQIRRDFPEAIRMWDLVIARFPRHWIGYRGKAHALAQSDRHAEADQLTETYAPTLPGDIDALHDFARLAERRRDWKQAEAVWRSFLAVDQRAAWSFLALASALREQARYAEAEDVLRDALPRFPNDVDLPTEAARCAEMLGNLEEAARLWRVVATLRPKSPDGPLGETSMLRRQGQTEAADVVVAAAIKRLPDEPSLLEAHGLNAMARNAWTEALTRLETSQRRFPSNDALRKRIFEVRLKIADEGGITPAAAPEHESDAEDRVLVMQFESLGGGGHGCEFGIFQRHFGAEPLGLLRWAEIFQDHLSIALETEFAGIGDPAFTNIFVPNGSTEYWTTDTRYHMAMRSFVLVADVTLDRMRQQVTKRFKFLSRKLADDLRSGTKIFVYKNMKRNLTDAELQRLHTACRRYGNNTLLYIRYEDADHPCGMVVAADDGLLIGYIDHFSHTPDTDEYIGSATDAFLQICRVAYALWQQAGDGAVTPAPAAPRMADTAFAGIVLDAVGLLPARNPAVEEVVSQDSALPGRREDCLYRIDLLTRQGKTVEARAEISDLIGQGANNDDLLHRVVKLSFTDDGFEWARGIWPQLANTIPDRQKLSHEAYLLVRQNHHNRDCQFLLTWMMSDPWSDRISELPLLVRVISQSRGTAQSQVVDELVVRDLHLVVDPMMRRVVRCMLHLYSDPNDYEKLVADILERATEHDMPKELLITLAGSGRPHAALVDAISRQLRALIETPLPLPRSADARIYLLIVVGDVLFPACAAALLAKLAGERTPSDEAATLSGVLSTMAHARRQALVSPALHSRSRLKICLCLSGQLRGYEAAFGSWRDMGLWNHDVTVVAHVWRDIGLRPPDNKYNASRAFSGEFLTVYQDVLESRGWLHVSENYPTLLRQLTAANHVDEQELRKLYASDAIVVEDEARPEFSRKGNFWKMYYKVKMAHQLGRSVCPDADLYIRARPDQDMSTFSAFDWRDLDKRANLDGVVFTDSKRFFAPPWVWMDDRLAIGSGRCLDIYAAAFDHVADGSAGRLYGYPTEYLPHSCFASTTQYFNIGVESLSHAQSFRLLNPPSMGSKEVARLIRSDMLARPEIAADTIFLSALERDVGSRSV
jgi:tetratricopeptide (TPR) repeat protein